MKRTVMLLITLCGGFLLFAQESQESQASSGDVSSDYRLDADGKIYQRIAWTRANAFFYEIEIEKLGSGAVWELELKERTEQNFLELSLPPGMYRYRILNYNVLGRVGATSEWVGIRVFFAKAPAVDTFSPAAYFVDSRSSEFTLVLIGRDLAEEAQVHIVAKEEGAQMVGASSLTYSPDEDSITAVFLSEGLALGAYDIVITNPGGVQQTVEGFTVGFTKPLNINVSLGYAPVFPLYGYLFDTYTARIYPLGVYGRISVIPVKRLWGWLGFELTPHYADLKTKTGAYSLTGRMISVHADLLFQRWNDGYTRALNLRLGGGITTITNIKFDHKDGSHSENVSVTELTINAGVSGQWRVGKSMFIEAGAEYLQFVGSQSPAPGFIRAAIAVGRIF